MSLKVAIAGVGNCANSLIQGVTFYADADESEVVPGLMHTRFGGYAIGDISFVAAFDVDAAKVGLDLSEAMWASQNNTLRFAEVATSGVLVQRGPTLDGLGEYYRELVEESALPVVDVAQALRDSGAEVLAQDEASSVVWGMPGAVVGAGLADEVLPLDRIAGALLNRVRVGRSPAVAR